MIQNYFNEYFMAIWMIFACCDDAFIPIKLLRSFGVFSLVWCGVCRRVHSTPQKYQFGGICFVDWKHLGNFVEKSLSFRYFFVSFSVVLLQRTHIVYNIHTLSPKSIFSLLCMEKIYPYLYKGDNVSYALGSKFANFQQII